jgi:transcriptional regulator with XRE-family HTH domain
MIPKQSKLLLLFFSKDNPLWKQLIAKGTVTQKDIAQASGVSQSTISNWRKGGSADIAVLEHEFNSLRDKIESSRNQNKQQMLEIVNRFWKQLTEGSREVPVYDIAASTLSMTMEDVQKTLDQIIYERFTLFPMLSYSNEETAKAYVQKYGGCYTIWLRRMDKRDLKKPRQVWLKCPLRVRYALYLGGRYVIRCKFNGPRFSTEAEERRFWEYDGFIRTRDNKVFWMFEKRENLGSDFFHAITGEGRYHGAVDGKDVRLTMSGTYLTTGQDDLRSIEHDDVLIQRYSLPPTADDADVRRWMHTGAQILDSELEETREEYKRVEELWRQFVGR